MIFDAFLVKHWHKENGPTRENHVPMNAADPALPRIAQRIPRESETIQSPVGPTLINQPAVY
jgi:hypothetical protein